MSVLHDVGMLLCKKVTSTSQKLLLIVIPHKRYATFAVQSMILIFCLQAAAGVALWTFVKPGCVFFVEYK